MWKFLSYNKFTLICSVIIIVLCAFPGDKMPSLDFMELFSFDKIAHILAFGTLCLVTAVGLAKYLHFSYMRKHTLTWAVIYAVFLSGGTELAQAFMAWHRHGDWMDFTADTIGVCLGAIFFLLLYTRQPMKI
jgi:VanZ family protein